MQIYLTTVLITMSSILVTGSGGQLGSEIKEISGAYEYNFFFTDRNSLDITNKNAVENFCLEKCIDVIVNGAAYTAVDNAEDDLVNADAINHLAVKNMARIAKENDIKLIQISTDYVFDGENHKPYTESDTTNPQSIYGKTKLDGEKAMQEINPSNSIIVRTSWSYSSFGANFVKTMLKLGRKKGELGVIFDQIGTPTYTRDLAEALLKILKNESLNLNNNVEIYNFSNEGLCSWYDFAKSIFELSGIDCKVNPIETKDFHTPAKRPHYSLLNKSKIKKKFKITIPYWRDSLKIALQKIDE